MLVKLFTNADISTLEKAINEWMLSRENAEKIIIDQQFCVGVGSGSRIYSVAIFYD